MPQWLRSRPGGSWKQEKSARFVTIRTTGWSRSAESTRSTSKTRACELKTPRHQCSINSSTIRVTLTDLTQESGRMRCFTRTPSNIRQHSTKNSRQLKAVCARQIENGTHLLLRLTSRVLQRPLCSAKNRPKSNALQPSELRPWNSLLLKKRKWMMMSMTNLERWMWLATVL